MEKHTLEVTTEMENMNEVMEFIEKHAQIVENPKTISQIVLVGEELALNVFSYAYDDKIGSLTLNIFINHEERRLCMEFRDNGKEFNPLLQQDPDLNTHISDRNIGGLGVMLSKRLTDEQSYVRENGQNILTVTKNY